MISTKNKRGFTIIEVVLVLAIAGLIFLMVFIALPALQKNQRDTQRRNDTAIIVSAVKNYMRHNSGNPPPDSGRDSSTSHTYDDDERKDTTWSSGNDSAALRRYLVDLDPGGVTTVVAVRNLIETKESTTRFTIGQSDLAGYATVYIGAKCPDLNVSGEVVTLVNTGKKSDFIVMRHMESGYWYCLEG